MNEIENIVKALRVELIDCSDRSCYGCFADGYRDYKEANGACDDGVMLAAADLIERLSAENVKKKAINWIPVTERLPEDGTRVLFYDVHNHIIVYGYKDGWHWFADDGGLKLDSDWITDWAEMPMPYKEEV